VRLEGLGKLKKKSLTSSGFESASIWLVAEYLNQLRYRVSERDDSLLILLAVL
jgi:hypothetical protein